MPIHALPGSGVVVSALMRGLQAICPPRRIFGSPVQRAKKAGQAYWHIPITVKRRFIGMPDQLTNCRLYLDLLPPDSGPLQLWWGDAVFSTTGETATLQQHETLLAPIAFREEGEGAVAVLADGRFLLHGERARTLGPGRRRIRFTLRVKSGKREYRSDQVYRLSVPGSPSNGQFTLEEEYEGSDSRLGLTGQPEPERTKSVTEAMGSPTVLLDPVPDPKRTKLEPSEPYLVPNPPDPSRWRLNVFNRGQVAVTNVQLKLLSIEPPQKFDKHPDFPFPVLQIGRTLDSNDCRINQGDHAKFELTMAWDAGDTHFTAFDTNAGWNRTAIVAGQKWLLHYQLTAENMDALVRETGQLPAD